MESLQHFSHDHVLSLVHTQTNQKNEDSDEEEEKVEEDENNFVEEDQHVGKCNMCKEEIYSFHLSYYRCKDCDYFLHKFCAELPTILENHPLHPGHNLTLSEKFQYTDPKFPNSDNTDNEWRCWACKLLRKNFFNYHCSICKFNTDIICATMPKQKMNHPSHPHQLERMFRHIVSTCDGCGKKHAGDFFHCTICPWFLIHLECALLPVKLLIQRHTDQAFTHSHPLTLAYSFPYSDVEDNFFPRCRVCYERFGGFLWLYKCDKCRYFVHLDCAVSKREPFMSILQSTSLGKTIKNFNDDDYPNLLHCPFPDECNNLLKQHFYSHKDSFVELYDDETFNHVGHQHPLILINTQASLRQKLVCLHNPMKKVQLLCDACVKPITSFPFYKCSEDAPQCGYVLHDWCARLPSHVQNHPGHPEHTLFLIPANPNLLYSVFRCDICRLVSNGFAYGCITCEKYFDINCAFIPEQITHEAHPNHLLSRINDSRKLLGRYCFACTFRMEKRMGFYCPSCDFYLHTECALLLPRLISHKHDKHPLSLRYLPVENHNGEYFCEICEDLLNPQQWFYHCTKCAQSMHAACVPLILHSEEAIHSSYPIYVFEYLNVKFGGMTKLSFHPHRLTFVQGIASDGRCNKCDKELQYRIIFKCLECKFAVHQFCANCLHVSVDSTDESSESD